MDEEELIIRAALDVLTEMEAHMYFHEDMGDVQEMVVGIKLPSRKIAEGVEINLQQSAQQLNLRTKVKLNASRPEDEGNFEFSFSWE